MAKQRLNSKTWCLGDNSLVKTFAKGRRIGAVSQANHEVLGGDTDSGINSSA
jgi:hypothetical protein